MTEQYMSRRERIAAERRAAQGGEPIENQIELNSELTVEPVPQSSAYDPLLSGSEEPLTSQHQILAETKRAENNDEGSPSNSADLTEELDENSPQSSNALPENSSSSEKLVSFQTDVVEVVVKAQPAEQKRTFEYEQFFDNLEVKPKKAKYHSKRLRALMLALATFLMAGGLLAAYYFELFN
ncbi:MAG: hypothetical protein RIR16_651 [Actinomycetota bacterium]